MTSKFFAQGNLSSDSSDEEVQVKAGGAVKNKIKNVAANLESDSDDQQKRVVRTEKEKKQLVFKNIGNKIKEKMKINDFSEIWNQFQALLKEIQKAKKNLDKEGYPPYIIKIIVNLSEFVSEFKQKNKLNASNSKAYSILKQKLKKTEAEFAKQIEAFKANPDAAKSEEEVQSESSEDSFQGDESSEEDEEISPLDSDDPMVRRTYWLKKKVEKPEKPERKNVGEEVREVKEPKEPKADKVVKPTYRLHEIKKKQTNFTTEEVRLKLKEISDSFGKQLKFEQREDFIEAIENIKKLLKTDSERLSVMLIEIPLRIEAARALHMPAFKKNDWNTIYQELRRMYTMVQESEEEDLLEGVETYKDEEEQKFYHEKFIFESMRSFFLTLEDELRKAYIFTDFNDIEYSERLRVLIEFIEFTHSLFKALDAREGYEAAAAEVGFKLLENTYYMNAETFAKIREESIEQKKPVPSFLDIEKEDRLEYLLSLILQRCDESKKTKAMLYVIYYHAIHYRPKARELLLITDVSDRASHGDFYTQALFNRVTVQIGLMAFRFGNMYEVQGALHEICSYGKTKELLAQGLSKLEKDQSLRKRILPYHMHINVDMVESVELIAAMIIEIPYTMNDGGKINSKTLKKVYDHYERSHFIAEPLNSRDLIYSASKELQHSRWQECFDRLMELNMWKLIHDSEETKRNLLQRIKEQSLKCFLLANQQTFLTLSLQNLALKFSLPLPDVRTLVNKSIYTGELTGSITEEGFIKLVHRQTNRMERALNHLYENALKLLERNERDFDIKMGKATRTDEEYDYNKNYGFKKRNVIMEKYNKKGGKKKY